VALGDPGYQGVAKHPANTNGATTWHPAMRPRVRMALQKTEKLEQAKATVRAKLSNAFMS